MKIIEKILLKKTALVLLFTITAFSQDNKLTVSIETFYSKIHSQEKPQIIDARDPEEFLLNHIAEAVNLNLETKNYKDKIAKLDKNKPVFIYSIGAGRSVKLANDLLKEGYKEVFVLEGGIASWIGSGKPFYANSKTGLTLTDFNNIIASNQNVLVEVGSKYCGACKKVKPILDNVKNQYGDTLKIIEIEFEENPQIVADLKTIKVFPTLILFQKGKIVFQKEGLENLQKNVEVALAQN